MLDKDTEQDVDELMRRTMQTEVPADVEVRLRGRLAEFRTRVEQRPPSRFRTLAYALTHRPAVRVMSMAAALLAVVTVGLVLIPRESGASRVFAAAAAQLRSSQSLQYTIVLAPYVQVEFSYMAPGYRRLNCSWGIEVRTDGTIGKQIVLMHAARTYLTESGKQVESQANTEDFLEQLRSLPQTADEVLGEKWTGTRKLIGYRLRKAPPNGSIPGLKELDIWIDAATGEADHVDITVQEPGKPADQMHIENIRVDGQVDRSVFDLAPPAGYTPIPIPSGATPAMNSPALQVQVSNSAAFTAVVMPMQGPYAQTRSALKAVESYLKTLGVRPVGPPFGRFGSEQHWDAGYPVPPGVGVDDPFQMVSSPAALTASAVVKGAWGQDSGPRWTAFLKAVVEQGYVPAGPPMEIWSGEDGKVVTQSTEMRMPVAKGKG